MSINNGTNDPAKPYAVGDVVWFHRPGADPKARPSRGQVTGPRGAKLRVGTPTGEALTVDRDAVVPAPPPPEVGEPVWYFDAAGERRSGQYAGPAENGWYLVALANGMQVPLDPGLAIDPPAEATKDSADAGKSSGAEPVEGSAAPQDDTGSQPVLPLAWSLLGDGSHSADNTAGVTTPDTEGARPAQFIVQSLGGEPEKWWADPDFELVDGLGDDWTSPEFDSAALAMAWCEARNRELATPAVPDPIALAQFEADGGKPGAVAPDAEPKPEPAPAPASWRDAEVPIEVPTPGVWEQILEARQHEADAEEEVEELKEQLKGAKAEHEKASKRLGTLLDEAKRPPGLFAPRPPVASAPAAPTVTVPPAPEQPAPQAAPGDDDAWKRKPVSALVELGLPEKVATLLTDNGVATLDDVAELQKSRWERPKIKGLGEKKQEAIDEAFGNYWVKYPQQKAAAGKPAALVWVETGGAWEAPNTAGTENATGHYARFFVTPGEDDDGKFYVESEHSDLDDDCPEHFENAAAAKDWCESRNRGLVDGRVDAPGSPGEGGAEPTAAEEPEAVVLDDAPEMAVPA